MKTTNCIEDMNFLIGRNKKKIRKDAPLIPILFAKLRTSLSKKNYQVIKVLLDSGASASVIHADLVKSLHVTKERETVWNTAGGNVTTGSMCNIEFSLPEFSPTATVSYKVHMSTQKTMFLKYAMIMGRELMTELGLNICFSEMCVKWPTYHLEIPMKDSDCTPETSMYIADTAHIQMESERLSKIVDAKYVLVPV